MATQTSKKKRSKKKKTIPSGDGSQGHDQVKESIPITPDLMDKNPGSSHKLLVEHIETPSLADTGFQQPYQRQYEDGEHQRESEIQISAQGQITNDGRKSKKKHKKKASSQSMNPHSDVLASESSTNEDKSFTFEEQVEWCIGQLELGLHRRDATKAQKDSNAKNIRTLRSLRVPMPRKRQLMRSLFGDYRSKMMATPLPGASAAAKGPCVSVVEREVAEDCGKFFKYKHSHTELINDIEGHSGCSEPFRFDFVINNK
jgi:hypothetical protein